MYLSECQKLIFLLVDLRGMWYNNRRGYLGIDSVLVMSTTYELFIWCTNTKCVNSSPCPSSSSSYVAPCPLSIYVYMYDSYNVMLAFRRQSHHMHMPSCTMRTYMIYICIDMNQAGFQVTAVLHSYTYLATWKSIRSHVVVFSDYL